MVHERPLWKTGKWLIAAAWLAWGFFMIRSWPGISNWRSLAAAAIWLLACINFVVPGPWKIQRPMGGNFHFENQTTYLPTATTTPPQTGIQVGTIPAEGKIPVEGSWVYRVKTMISQARPILHALLLFLPALTMMCLIGIKPALWLSIILAIAIESMQAVFGFGFDWIDIADLTCDLAGVWLAVRCYARLVGIRWIAVHDSAINLLIKPAPP